MGDRARRRATRGGDRQDHRGTPRATVHCREGGDAAAQGIADASPGTCGWIVDLRDNTGGDMYPMLSGVAPLLPNGPALSFVTNGGQETVVTVQDDGAGLAGGTTI